MSTSDQLSNTFLGYLNLDMSNHSYPLFPDLYDYITPPSPSVSYTLPMMPTPISSRLAPPPTPILAPQTVPDPLSPPPFPPPLVLSFRKPDGNFYWQFVFIVHSVAEKLNYSKCKHDVSRAVGIPFSGDSGHQGTESPLQEIWWGFRPVGIPSSGDSGYIPIQRSISLFKGLRRGDFDILHRRDDIPNV